MPCHYATIKINCQCKKNPVLNHMEEEDQCSQSKSLGYIFVIAVLVSTKSKMIFILNFSWTLFNLLDIPVK